MKSLFKNVLDKLDVTLYVLIAITAAGFFLRVHSLMNDSLWIDEGYTIMQQRAISAHGYPLLMSGYKEIKDVLLPYMLAGVNFIGGDNLFLFRLVSVVFGTFSVWLMFLIGKNLANRYIGLISAFLMSFSYWHIAWDRQIRAYSVLVFFILLSLYFLIKYEKSNANKYLSLSLFSIALAILAKSSFGMLLLPAFAAYIILKKKYKLLAVCLGASLLLSIFFKKTLLDALSASIVNYFPYYFLGYFWQYFGIIFVISLFGFYLTISQQRKYLHVHIFNAIYFIFPLVFFSFFSYVNQKRYLFFVTPLMFVYASYFIYYLSIGFAKKRTSVWIIFFIIVIFVVDFMTMKSIQLFPKEKYALENYTPQPNFTLAYESIKKEMGAGDIIVSAYPYMDFIYLDRFNYALGISYTGRFDDSSLHNSREFYTGALAISSVEEIRSIRKKSNVFIVLDSMATGRINSEIYQYIKTEGSIILEDNQPLDQRIYVYKLSGI